MKRWLAPGAAIAVMLIGITLIYQSAAISSRSGNDAPLYSVRRHDPYGTAALHDLLSERGLDVSTLERPTLESGAHGVLIQVLPTNRSMRSGDNHLQTGQLADWMARGNTIIQFTRAPTDLMARFKIPPSTQPAADTAALQDFETKGDPPSEAPADISRAQLDGGGDKRLLLWSPMKFDDMHNPNWKPLARLPGRKGKVVAGEYRVGLGRLIVVGAPTPTLNGTIGDEANLDFILSQIASGPVIFDEWSHGIGHEATIMGFLEKIGLLPVLFQLAFLAILYCWSTSGYRAKDDGETPRQRSSIEQVQTLGFLYSRSLRANVMFDRIDAEVRRRLAEALHCPPHALSARLALVNPVLRGKIERLIGTLSQVQPPHGAICQGCGYDLFANVSGRCPECGAAIPMEIHRRIADAASVGAPGANRARTRPDRAYAEALTLSYQLAQEVQRERRVIR